MVDALELLVKEIEKFKINFNQINFDSIRVHRHAPVVTGASDTDLLTMTVTTEALVVPWKT